MNLLLILLAFAVADIAYGFNDTTGYESFAGTNSSYRLHRERVTWDTASRVCELEGGHLLVINSQDEAVISNLLFGRMAAFDPPFPWGYDLLHVGITDRAKEGSWLTVLGEPVNTSGYNVWRKGQPNNHHRSEHCGAIDRVGEFSDLECTGFGYLCPFICETGDGAVIEK